MFLSHEGYRGMSRRLGAFRCSCKGDDPKGAIIHGAEASIGLPLRLCSRMSGEERCFPPREGRGSTSPRFYGKGRGRIPPSGQAQARIPQIHQKRHRGRGPVVHPPANRSGATPSLGLPLLGRVLADAPDWRHPSRLRSRSERSLHT